MSVDPIPAAAESSELPAAATPVLRLVPAHEHTWQLRAVDYDEAFEVRRYECEGCDEVLFR